MARSNIDRRIALTHGGDVTLVITRSHRPEFDARDAEILATRATSLEANRINVGDFIVFADGTERRVSHIWTDSDGFPFSVQTSSGGSWHLSEGWVSFSGALYHGTPFSSLTLTSDRRDGLVWFFHHGYAGADRGVDASVSFRVWYCDLDPEVC